MGSSAPSTSGSSTNAGQFSWAGGPTGSGTVQNIFDAPATKQFGGQILSDAKTAYSQGPKVFNESLYAGQGDTTQGGLAALLGVDSSAYMGGLTGAMSDYADTAMGGKLGIKDPGYAALRGKLQSDVTGAVGSSFANTGTYGADSNVKTLTDELTSSLGALDYQQYGDSINRQNQALGALPGIYQAMLAPGQTQLGVGQVQDADAQAQLTAQNDLFRRQNDAPYTQVAQYLNLLQGGGGKDGVLTPDAPWWLGALGSAGQVAGNVLGAIF